MNGVVRLEPGAQADPAVDAITFDGQPIGARDTRTYLLLHKPRGYLTSLKDPDARPVVVDLLPADTPRLFPVGRLDYDAEGLLLLTNDGDLTQRLTHPSHGVGKTYLVEVEGVPGPAALRRLREGVELDDGPTAPARAHLVQARGDTSAVEVTIHEGRNRQVRRMCTAIGHPVVRLVRTKIGPLRDPDLTPGASRVLRPQEVRRLYEATNGPGPSNPPQ